MVRLNFKNDRGLCAGQEVSAERKIRKVVPGLKCVAASCEEQGCRFRCGAVVRPTAVHTTGERPLYRHEISGDIVRQIDMHYKSPLL